MPSTKELRRRIKSVKNTAQITKAMQMVSATKMRRAQIQALASRPYTLTMNNIMANVSGKINPDIHPLLKSNSSNKIGVLVISTDKGLCGALNTNLIRMIQSNDLFKKDIVFYTLGKKVRDYLVRVNKFLEADFENVERATFKEAAQIRKYLIASFLEEKIGEVYLLYPDFVSTLRQEAKLIKILPIESDELGIMNHESSDRTNEFLFEPSADEVLDLLLIHLIDTSIYQAMMETKASEHSARMMAMQNATDNARDLVSDLTLTYNQARQSAITTELLEITSAAAALE